MGANPGKRPSPQDVITKLRRSPGFFKNDLIDIVLFLEELQIKEEGDKSRFFTSLPGLLDNCPTNVCQVRNHCVSDLSCTKSMSKLEGWSLGLPTTHYIEFNYSSLRFPGQDPSAIDQCIRVWRCRQCHLSTCLQNWQGARHSGGNFYFNYLSK